MDWTTLIFLLVALAFSAFFSGLEFAFISANKLELELMKEKGGWLNKTIYNFYKKPDYFLGTTLMGNNIALVIYGILFAKLVDVPIANAIGIDPSNSAILFIDTILSTIIVLFLGEYMPKNLLGINPTGALRVFAMPFQIIYWLLSLPVMLVVWLTRFFLNVFFDSSELEKEAVFTKVDLNEFVKQSAQNVTEEDEIDTDMFERALELPQIKIRECMIPRNEIVGIEQGYTLEDLRKRYIETGLSRILVFDDSLDKIIGYTHHQDILRKRKTMYDLVFIPETMPAPDALDKLINEKKGLAIVIDEHGGTAGMVTVEDILEEVFGEIQDEFDDEDALLEELVDENTYRLSARIEVDYLNEKYDLDLPFGEYETIGGMATHHLERIPRRNEEIQIGRYLIKVLSAEKAKIETIELAVLSEEEEEN